MPTGCGRPSPPMTRCCVRRSRPHGSWVFKHTGDGVCAAFASPPSAVDAAVAAQRALELPVRMGLATGEAELRAVDYFCAVAASRGTG
jgi:class 3 adenylate cyclase